MTTRAFPKVPWSLRKPIKANPKDHFSAEELEKSKSYQRPLQYVGLAASIISTAVGLTLVGTKIFPTWAENSSLAWPLQLVAVIGAIILVTQVISLPLGIWAEFGHEKKWGFSTQTPGRYTGDQLKGLLLGVVLLSILFIPVWMLIRSTELWWVFGGLVFMAFSVFVAFILPVVILPIFNKFTPLEDEALRTRLAELATKADVSISDYQVMDASKRTRKDNAFFAGLGKTRRVVVFDNLLELPAECVGVVVAHEIGHWRRGHIKRQLLLGLITSFGIFAFVHWAMTQGALLDWAGLTSIASSATGGRAETSPAALPLFLVAFSAASFVSGLISAWVSRWSEREADLDALDLTDDTQAYQELWRRMSSRNLPDLDPSWWHRLRGSHPPIAERITFAQAWAKTKV